MHNLDLNDDRSSEWDSLQGEICGRVLAPVIGRYGVLLLALAPY